MPANRLSLPIDALLPELVAELEERPSLVLQASPGAGKTTRVPPALLEARFARGKEILVLEPRRLAAKLSARRVAEEMGEEVGGTVGYQFRFETVASQATRLRFITEGLLMRRLLSDPELRGVAAVVLDEFHERHLHGDLALAALKRLQESRRRDLRIVVMSATLESEALSQYLGGCRVLRIDARRFEVGLEYLKPARYLDQAVRAAVERAVDEESGDVLVFLPGMGEIRRCEQALEPLARERKLLVLPLHGELTREEQDRAVGRADRRKVILSTNVAETSLTIEGVTAVIDSGLARVASYSFWSGLPALRTRPISRASAIQRAGRAGRTAPGTCYRLYEKADFDGRPSFETPEILRADLSQAFLELKAMGHADPAGLPWFEAPKPQAVESANSLLRALGAVAEDGAITALGRRMAQIPAHPRLSRVLLECERRVILSEGTTFVAALSEGKVEALDALSGVRQLGRDAFVQRVASRLGQGLRAQAGPSGDPERALRFALLTGFPDRVARKRAGSERDGRVDLVFSSGGSAAADLAGLPEGDWFVALDLEERQRAGQARSQLAVSAVVPVEVDWLLDLEPSGVRESEELVWVAERKRVESVSRLSYGELVLSESRQAPTDPEAAARVLAAQLLQTGAWRSEELDGLLARVAFLRAAAPELAAEVPAEEALVRQALELACIGRASLAELEDAALPALVAESLPAELRGRLESWAPSHLTLPRGRRVRIQYEPGKPPWVESRLQDFFGMKDGPALLGGKVRLVMHLLAPNQRAVQVTSDLAGFWQRNYPALRKELGRRYPRHFWPEDPINPPPEPPRRRT